MRDMGTRVAVALAAVLVALVAGAASADAATGCPWMDAGKSPEQRANELIAAMTLDQKIHQVHQSDPPWVALLRHRWPHRRHARAVHPHTCPQRRRLRRGRHPAGHNDLPVR